MVIHLVILHNASGEELVQDFTMVHLEMLGLKQMVCIKMIVAMQTEELIYGHTVIQHQD